MPRRVSSFALLLLASCTDFAADFPSVSCADYPDLDCLEVDLADGQEAVLTAVNTVFYDAVVVLGAGEGGLNLIYDIVPGDPDASILLYRMETNELGAMMPLLGRALTDELGVDLIRRWILEMEPDDCGS